MEPYETRCHYTRNAVKLLQIWWIPHPGALASGGTMVGTTGTTYHNRQTKTQGKLGSMAVMFDGQHYLQYMTSLQNCSKIITTLPVH